MDKSLPRLDAEVSLYLFVPHLAGASTSSPKVTYATRST